VQWSAVEQMKFHKIFHLYYREAGLGPPEVPEGLSTRSWLEGALTSGC
jgi:hypothetical protein